jgi:hypothetical protein
MATFRSDAVKAGVRPDDLRAGVLLTRVGLYAIPSSSKPAVGDVIQMVPVPKNAKVIDVHVTTDGTTTSNAKVHCGDGGDSDRYAASMAVKTAAHVSYLVDKVALAVTYSADDTIDLTIASAAPDTAGKYLQVIAQYVMEGTIADEDTDASSKIP